MDTNDIFSATPPSEHVQFLLGEDVGDEDHKAHDLFCQLGELSRHDGETEWKETARWIKFEEDVEEGGERWSKPHVATLSLHSLFDLRSCIHNGTVILDLEVTAFYQVTDIVLDRLIAANQLEGALKDRLRGVLLQRHRHLNERTHRENSNSKINMPIIRSLADIGMKYSYPKTEDQENNSTVQTMHRTVLQTTNGAKCQFSNDKTALSRNQSSGKELQESPLTKAVREIRLCDSSCTNPESGVL